MKMQEFYERLGAEYDIVLERFLGKEDLLKKFVLLFLKDDTYEKVVKAYESNDYNELERTSHTLKGIVANLGFECLYVDCSKMVNNLRKDNLDNIRLDYEAICDDYNLVRSSILNIE